uniref:ABC-F family ATP-binding cassette domain-containing protein n=1 Tax=Prevotella melaninogenica TaxID=28132 RepID=UPI003C7611D3
MISIDGLTVEFGVKPLFKDVSFVINERDRIALVGKNGAGKSTMLKILCGMQKPTSGVVSVPNDTTIGYLPQVMKLSDDTTVKEETRKAFADKTKIEEKLKKMEQEMAERTDYESEGYAELVERFTTEHERYMMMGGENYEAEIERTLTGLGFSRDDFDRPTREFSGGWRMRIELAKILLRRPDVLLLDEPTNHLDIESIQWLEQFLSQSAKAVVLVSHDRAFVNNVTNRTLEITCGHVEDYRVKYDEYLVLRKERREQQLRAYENQQKEIADTKAFIERFRYQATKAVQVQQRIRQLEKIVPIEVDEVDNSAMRLKFPPCLRSGDYPVIAEGLGKTYPSRLHSDGPGQTVFEGVDLIIKRGEKVAFVGKNGEGKSTFVKCIMGEIPFDGTLKIGHNVQIGYFAQNQAQLLDENLTIYETIDRVATGDMRLRINDLLGAFMFGGETSEKYVKVLSGGERSRLAMIKLLLEPVNLLILDEPTNHLDIASKEVLKEAIKAFDGTAIIVSHDREFLDGLVSKVYEFGGGKVREHLGGIYDWLRSPLQLPRKGESAENLSLTSSKSNNNQNTSPLPSEGSGE